MTFWQVYGYIILEFLFEYSVFAALFLYKRKRRGQFALRVVPGVVLLFAIGLPVAYFYSAFGGTLWGRILVYLFLFGVYTLIAFGCFDEKYLTVFFCCGMAYAAQNLVYKVYLILYTLGEQFKLYDNWNENFNLYYRTMYYTIFVVCAFLVWLLFIRRITEKLKTSEINKRMLVITALILAITIILCSIEDLAFAQLCVWRENRFEEPIYYVLRQTGNLFSCLCCVIVLVLASNAIVENELLKEVEYLKHTIRQGERQYKMSKDSIELINIKCHDIKYKLDALTAQGGLKPESVKELRDSISIYDSRIETGNQLLNVLITEKSLYCEQNGINLSCMIDGEKLDFMESGDLYCLFGNIVDNALEAVKAIEEKERRVINILVKVKNRIVLVQEENYFNGTLDFEDGLPVTTKEDKSSHGFGMRSIRLIVEKYGGELTASVDGDIFHLNVMFAR